MWQVFSLISLKEKCCNQFPYLMHKNPNSGQRKKNDVKKCVDRSAKWGPSHLKVAFEFLQP